MGGRQQRPSIKTRKIVAYAALDAVVYPTGMTANTHTIPYKIQSCLLSVVPGTEPHASEAARAGRDGSQGEMEGE